MSSPYGFFSRQCPHCKTENIALQLVCLPTRIHASSNGALDFDGTVNPGLTATFCNAFLACPKCKQPISMRLRFDAQRSQSVFDPVLLQNVDLGLHNWLQVVEQYPDGGPSGAPEFTPDPIARVFRQAVSNLERQNLDGAGMLYRRTMEQAVKHFLTDAEKAKKSFFQLIALLKEKGLIPEAMAEWATEVRLLGNNAAHESDEPSLQDVKAAHSFTEAFLNYAFTMPERVKRARAASAGPSTAQVAGSPP